MSPSMERKLSRPKLPAIWYRATLPQINHLTCLQPRLIMMIIISWEFPEIAPRADYRLPNREEKTPSYLNTSVPRRRNKIIGALSSSPEQTKKKLEESLRKMPIRQSAETLNSVRRPWRVFGMFAHSPNGITECTTIRWRKVKNHTDGARGTQKNERSFAAHSNNPRLVWGDGAKGAC